MIKSRFCGDVGAAVAMAVSWVSQVRSEPVTLTTSGMVYPVLIGKDRNPLLEVRVTTEAHGIRLQRLVVSLEGTDDFSDVEVVEVLTRTDGAQFPDEERFGQPAAAAGTVVFEGDTPLVPGTTTFWVSCRLRRSAGLTRSVTVACPQIETTAGETTPFPPVEPVRRRIGVAVRRAFDDGVHTHRIPVLATSAKGTLLLVHDLRHRGARDLQGDIDVGLARSTDGGQSWSPSRVILDMGEHTGLGQEENGCGDPGLIVDRQTGEIFCFALWMHGKSGSHQWVGEGSEPGYDPGTTAQFMMVKSSDDGVTWSAPENLTRRLKQKEWWLLAPSPQQGIQLSDGTLVMPVQGRDEAGVPFATVMLSQDHGGSWELGSPARSQANECQAAELSDGSLMLNMRNDQARHRAVAVTRDRGRTWEHQAAAEAALIEPNCNASVLALPSTPDSSIGHALVFVNPRRTDSRSHQTLQVSLDDGATWPSSHHLRLDDGTGFGYASLTRVDDQHIGVVYEGSQAQLVYEKVALRELGLPPGSRRWARPEELRTKKLIDAGLYTLEASPAPLTSATLAAHPEFTLHHPFDGIAVRVGLIWPQIASDACAPDPLEGEARSETTLDALAWARWPVPEAAVESAVAEFKRVQWGALTDNFLWWNCRGGADALKADLANDADWQSVCANARLAARVCRAAGLKGFLFDTEQYSAGKTGKPHPFGSADPDTLTRRGREWIAAVQSEFPEVRVMFTFGWSPDLEAAGFLAGVKPFLDGMLSGVAAPARFIHGYENAFYYGQRAGSRFTANGFDGSRTRYESARRAMRDWRQLSGDPAKFDTFVDVGMAAWLESDPWNLWSGYPSGSRETIWSNVPMALATSDEYVWCWSEHTNYLQSALEPDDGLGGLNPFLASLANQTFNTGKEQASEVSEDFVTDPLKRGWTFDFDQLAAGRWVHAVQQVPVLSSESAWARWSATETCVVFGPGNGGFADGRAPRPGGWQRQRFVRPVAADGAGSFEAATMEFALEAFGEEFERPMVIGIFRSDHTLAARSFGLEIGPRGRARWRLPAGWTLHSAAPESTLTVGVRYRLDWRWQAATADHRVSLTTENDEPVSSVITAPVDPGVEGGFDEIGVALEESGQIESLPATRRGRLYRVTYRSR